MKGIQFLFFFVCLLTGTRVFSQKAISIQAAVGWQVTIPSKLTVEQEGYPDIVIKKATYVAESFRLPPYWDYGATFLFGNHGIGLRTTHYKIIMENTTENVSVFRVTHGYNSVMLQYLYDLDHFYISPAVGVALAHPENTIRGQRHIQKNGIQGKGYYLTGPVFYGTIGKKLALTKQLFFLAESKFTAGYVDVPVVDGRAYFWHWSWVLQAGLCFDIGL